MIKKIIEHYEGVAKYWQDMAYSERKKRKEQQEYLEKYQKLAEHWRAIAEEERDKKEYWKKETKALKDYIKSQHKED